MNQVAILGFGREGKAVLNFLKKSPIYKDAHIEIRDKKFGSCYLSRLEQFDIIFRSPGIPYTLPEIQKAVRSGVRITSATELFFSTVGGSAYGGEKFKYSNCKIIGITGTKGKSTTATLIYKILKASGRDAYLVGNIGKPAIEIIPKLKRNSIVVLELSSFQLQNLHHSPHIAVVLDIFPDHMDAHNSFKEYVGSKANITKWQRKNDIVFYANGNRYTEAIAKKSHGKKLVVDHNSPYSRAMPRTELRSGTGELENKIRNLIMLPGEHQLKNALMAATVTSYLKIPIKIVFKTISKFKGLPHRIELVRRISIKQTNISSKVLKNFGTNKDTYFSAGKISVDFYNDSASTNPHTTAAAIKSFNNPVILIAGGKDKNLDYGPLCKTLKRSSVTSVVLYGENRHKIARALTYNLQPITHNIKPIKLCQNLNKATKIAYNDAMNLGIVGSKSSVVNCTILLSPASASFDQFRDYKHRGEVFKLFVKKIKET